LVVKLRGYHGDLTERCSVQPGVRLSPPPPPPPPPPPSSPPPPPPKLVSKNCGDVPPDKTYTCADQAGWGQVGLPPFINAFFALLLLLSSTPFLQFRFCSHQRLSKAVLFLTQACLQHCTLRHCLLLLSATRAGCW
jgi:hypothetical protein